MKKFLTLFVSAAVTLSAAAVGLKDSRNLNLNTNPERLQMGFSENKSGSLKKNAEIVTKDLRQKSIAEAPIAKMVKKPAKASANASSLEGTWIFTLGDYYLWLEGSVEYEFEATVYGDEVIFEEVSGWIYPFIGVYDQSTSTLSFYPEALGSNGWYYMAQQPFVYDAAEDWPESVESISATYDAELGTLTFGAREGLAWLAFEDANYQSLVDYWDIFDFEAASNLPWTKMDNAKFNENIIYGTFTGEENKVFADVEVYEHPTKAGVYKVIDPFKTLYGDLGFIGTSPNMVINATNPDNVFVELQNTGISGGTDGVYYYFNEGWYCDEYEEDLDPAFICTLTNDNGNVTITFPYHSCTVYASGSGKFYYGSAYESTLTFTIPAPAGPEMEVIGTMSGQNDMNVGQTDEPDLIDPVEVELKGYYADGKLTISPMLNVNDHPVTFTIDLATGNAVAENCFIDSRDVMGDGTLLDYYYGDLATHEPNLYAQIYNTSENTSELVIRPWGEMGDYTALGFGMWFEVVYYNTVAQLNFAIEGLPEKAEEFEVPANVEGKWTFSLYGHYLGNYSLGMFTEEFDAVLDGKTVKFESTGSQYNIVGEFTSPTTIAFKKAAAGTPAVYTLTQVPFVNNGFVGTLEDLAESQLVDAVVANYNEETGVISFPYNSGLLYGYFDANGTLSYWDDAFDFSVAVKVPDIEVTQAVVTEVTATTATVAVTPVFGALPEGAEVYVVLSNGYDVTIEEQFIGESGGVVVVTLAGLTPETEYRYYASAVIKSGDQVFSTSNSLPVQFTTADITDGVENITVDGSDNAVFFNVNGTRVQGGNLPAGVYVKVVDGKATKVIVK